jgi:hypothetical protein
MHTKQMNCMKFALLICAGGLSQAQDDRNLLHVNPMIRPDSVHASQVLVDRGRLGSPDRIPSEKFSGSARKPLGGLPAGLQGSPRMKVAKAPDGLGYTNVVTISSAQAAEMVVTQPGHAVPDAAHAKADVATASDPRAQLVAPQTGTILPPIQTFAWQAGFDASEYYLWVGSCLHCTDVLNESEGLNLSRNVTLPNDGRIVYVTLFTYVNDLWYYVDYSFYTLNGAVPAYLSSPANGSTVGSPQTFSWTTGSKVTEHFLWIGSCQDCNDILNENEGLNTSRTVTLPVDGRTIFVTLFSYIQGNWYYYDYQFHGGTAVPLRVVVTNNLGYSVDIFVNGGYVGSVNPFSTQYANVTVASLLVSFKVDQPVLNGKVLGDAMAGYFNQINNVSGTYNFSITNIIGTTWYFLPELTNQTWSPLAIQVNGGLQAQNNCGCEAPAYSTNVAAGYYLLYSNSNVRGFYPANNYTGPYDFWGEDSSGAVSPGGLLYLNTAANTGIIHLTANTLP